MTRRKPVSRVLAGLLGLWLPLLLAEPVAMHGCAMHGVARERAQEVPQAVSQDSHHNHHAQLATPATPAPDHSQHQECSCIGQCASASVTVVPSFTTLGLAVTTATITTEQPVYQSSAFVSHEHVLPFANGPPVLA